MRAKILAISGTAAGLCGLMFGDISVGQVPAPTRAEQRLERREAQAAPAATGQRPNAAAPATTPPRLQTVNKPVAGQQSEDGLVATMLLMGNKGEVKMGKFAAEHAKSEQTRKFANEMVTDHNKMIDELNKFAKEPGADMPGVKNLLNTKQQVGERCMAMTEKEMSKKQGTEFDQAYIGQQIGKHIEMLAMLEVLREQASPELQKVIDNGTQVTQQHKNHAEHIMEELKSQSGAPAKSAR